jgi:hypothetical protein
MRVAGGVDVQPATGLAHRQAKIRKEMLGNFEIRHIEGEMVDRVNAERAGAPRGFDEAVDLCHVDLLA